MSDEAVVVFKKKSNLSKSRAASANKRDQSPPPTSALSTLVHSTITPSHKIVGQSSKRTKTDQDFSRSESTINYVGTGTIENSNKNYAVSGVGEADIDGPSLEEMLAIEQANAHLNVKSSKKVKEEGGNKHFRIGPQRASAHLRGVTFTDYQPDVCKDYKETGFCGFGDTCKFMHDRGDYMAGWQLDKQYDKTQAALFKGKDKRQLDIPDQEEEELPFACAICRQPFTDPVETRCKHYFCQACALKRFIKTPKCATCGSSTGGIFNKAEPILKKMAQTKLAKEQRAKEEARDAFDALDPDQAAADDDDSDDDD